MNKKYTLFLTLIIVAIFSFSLFKTETFATVGGPTYISQISYDSSKNLIYYLENDYGGKGCPPILHSINLTNGTDSEIKDCNQVFDEFLKTYSPENEQKYREFISNLNQGLPYLGSVNLKKNNINIKVEVISEEVEEGMKFWTNFRATVTQNNKKIGQIDFRGCEEDQPHVFEGYKIPDSDLMAILISNKGDCFEGGYVRETLQLIEGVKYYDNNFVRSFKSASATEPNSGNLIVFASADNSGTKNGKSNIYYVSIVILALIVGIFIGRFVKK